MTLAQIGPFTTLAESIATAVGAGMLLGGFTLGTVGFLGGRSRRELAERALTDGYAGGVVGVVSFLLDSALRYA